MFMLGGLLWAAVTVNAQQKEPVKDSFYLLSPVEVKAVRASDAAPLTKTNLSKSAISKNNMGQDIPFLLNQTPGVVVNADAGNGVGYTGIRIRGTDATRINVTLNGIPYNDAESQGTFFVDLPDIASSTGSIQVQRGVGTSSNGAGAFGGSINISTNESSLLPYANINNSYGSFNTWKNTISAGTGIQNGFSTDFRYSHISSDGYIDRAFSKLHSWYFSEAYTGKRGSVRLNVFTGKEKTYQAWYGVSEADLLAGNRRINYAGTEKPGTPYENETDNYTQTHYQLFLTRQFGKRFSFNTAFFLTRGKGYYEEYRADEDYSKYHLPYPVNGPDTTFTSDFIRQLWLDNYFYGNVFSLQYKNNRRQATLGGGITRYDGKHYGKVIWASNGLTGLDTWYHLKALKTDATIYLKEQTQWMTHWYYFYDLQYRHVHYNIDGFRDNPDLMVRNRYDFFNPKAGISYIRNGWKGYTSFGIANKEPNRDDFEAGAAQQPLPERLYDWEAGLERSAKNYSWSAVFYYMSYKNQLVLTGKINDVGAYTRTNIAKSYRAGIELEGQWQVTAKWSVSGNLALSRNKVRDFQEYVDDYDNGGQKRNQYHRTDIALSPAVVGAGAINYKPIKQIELSWLAKYVSRQYLDNTQLESRSLDAFFVQDLRITFTPLLKTAPEVTLIGRVNNLFNVNYEPSGYTYSYIYGGAQTTENYYFPMAGINYMISLNIRL